MKYSYKTFLSGSLVFIMALFAFMTTSACDKDGNGGELKTKAYLQNEQFAEGATNIHLTISLTEAVTSEITVSFHTTDGTAKVNEDYEAKTGEITFAAGETKKEVPLVVLNDTLREADEYFGVTITAISGGTFETVPAGITILNDDTWIVFPVNGYSTPDQYTGYHLEWSDEFNGPNISSSNWSFEVGDGCPNNCGWGNSELEWYTDRPQNSFITDGKLVIEARRENMGGKLYTSARMKSQGKKFFQFGRIDIRALLPVGQGIWPAIWMLGENINSKGWPACGEIDIMEYLGHESNKVYGTGHWGFNIASHQYQGSSILSQGNNYNEAWHVFSISWKEDEIIWLVDDVPFFTLTPSQTSQNHPFNDPFFFIFNVAVGGNWPGSPDGNTVFPQRLAIDYVRVFQQ